MTGVLEWLDGRTYVATYRVSTRWWGTYEDWGSLTVHYWWPR